MPLDKMLVDEHWAAAGRQTDYEGSFICGIECFDTFYARTLVACLIAQGTAGACTNDVVCNVLGRSLRVVANDQPPVSGKRTVGYRRAVA